MLPDKYDIMSSNGESGEAIELEVLGDMIMTIFGEFGGQLLDGWVAEYQDLEREKAHRKVLNRGLNFINSVVGPDFVGQIKNWPESP